MAIEVEITGNGVYKGAKSNIGAYTVSEESTPTQASDTTGGTGQITFTAIEDPARFGSTLLLNDTITLTDGDKGMTTGKINSVAATDGVLNITADSRLGRLVIDVAAGPVNGTLTSVLGYYLGLGGITDEVAIEDTIANIPILAPGWKGDLWTKIKELLVTVGAEISLVRGTVVIRPVRQRRALEINNSSESWTITNIDLAKQVEVYYYNTTMITDGLVYPYGGWNEDVTVYSVDANDILEVNIPVNVSLTELEQPVIQEFVGPDETASVYSVIGNDGLPITPAQWEATGGQLVVSIGEDAQSIDLKVVGPKGATGIQYAPYRIAVASGPSDYYSSLRIRGTGVGFEQKTYTMPTGADETMTSREVGVTVDNVFIDTEDQAKDIALAVGAAWASPQRTINITKADINKPGSDGSDYNYATFNEFNAYASTESLVSFNNFNTEWSGKTFDDFNEYWYDLVKDSFDFQVYGNAAGARIQWRRAMYRIRTAEISESNVTYSAEADTTIQDFNDHAVGLSFDDFNTEFADLSFNDFALIPLIQVAPEYDN